MKKLPSYILVLMFVFVSACFLTYQITYTFTDNIWKSRVNDMLKSSGPDVSDGFYELSETISKNYLYPSSQEMLQKGVMSGYVKALPDNFSMYMDEGEYRSYLDFENAVNNVGIGVNTLYDSSLDGIYVINVYKGSPAESAGMVPGDVIVSIGERPVTELGYYGVMAELGTGGENEEALLGVRRITGETVTFRLVKSKVDSERITGKRLGNNIGLITISNFETGDEERFKEVLRSLITSDCEKFVIDVRNNSGGSIEAISRILDFLTPEGNMFAITDKMGATNTMTSDANSVPYPLAVIVNERTVCGAEVFASVLSAGETTKLFGTKTYGKASNQSVFPLSHGAAVSLSVTKYLPSQSADFDGVGVIPDETIELSDEDKMRFTTLANNEDAQILAAIEYLKTQKQSSVKD